MQYNIVTTEDVNKMLNIASEAAKKYNASEIATEYLVFGILKMQNTNCQKLLDDFGVIASEFEVILSESELNNSIYKTPELTPKSKRVFVGAQNLAKELQSPSVDLEHILFSILMASDCVAVNILDKVFNVNIIDLKSKLLESIKRKTSQFQSEQNNKNFSNDAKNEQKNDKNTQKNAKNQEILEKNDKFGNSNPLFDLGIDLTEKAKNGKIDPIIGRDKEIERLVEILCRKAKNNPCLIGEAGVGKSAVVEGLALKIISGDVPRELKDKTIFSFDISGLMSGT
ncbi:MAG: ATP-dependent Clp protease ATP-binding subunit [Clostridia bacterium]|nr:ATP-dependent Clp protease ATP-binding subunit [Clostridia bacterium]